MVIGSGFNGRTGSDEMAQEHKIMVEHENGYRGILYGKSSMSIFKGDKEVLHTGFRNINTADELYEELSEMPSFMEMLANIDFDNNEQPTAYDIDKQDGTSDDVCEWKNQGLYGYYTGCTEFRSKVAYKDVYWKYCPYCSKKIKVVE